jgi:hypothetical protein
MTENINSEALNKLFEIDGELYGAPSLARMARIRASILHASSAWGCSDDGALIGALADEVERLTPYVEAFRREERRADDLATEADRLREAHSTVEAELTANERMVDVLRGTLMTIGDHNRFGWTIQTEVARAALGETE